MRRQSVAILAVVLALVGGVAALLGYWRHVQKLGLPGLKIVAEPIHDPDGKVVGTHSVPLPRDVLNYESSPLPVTPLELGWLPADTTYGRRHYRAPDGFQIAVSVVVMGTDRTSIHKPQYCLAGQGWRIDRTERDTVRVTRPHAYDLPVLKLTCTGTQKTAAGQEVPARGIYTYWFVADGRLTADHLQRMWWMAEELMRNGTLQRWAYVTCFAVCPPGQEDAAYARVKEFIAASVPKFQITTGRPLERERAAAAGPVP